MAEKGIQVIDRALDILELLSLEKDGLGVTEIGKRTGLHKSTVHRVLSALAERGYIEKVSSSGAYRLGLKLVELSSVYLNNLELKTEARPILHELASKLNQPVHLAILDGCDAVYIDKVDVVNSIRLYSQIGRRIPAYCSALGKSLLSGLPDMEVRERLSGCRLEKFTANTRTDIGGLLDEIRRVRQAGWSIDDCEHDEGIRCIAAPVYDYRARLIAAVSVAGSSSVITPDKDVDTAKMVTEAAAEISKRLGYN